MSDDPARYSDEANVEPNREHDEHQIADAPRLDVATTDEQAAILARAVEIVEEQTRYFVGVDVATDRDETVITRVVTRPGYVREIRIELRLR